MGESHSQSFLSCVKKVTKTVKKEVKLDSRVKGWGKELLRILFDR